MSLFHLCLGISIATHIARTVYELLKVRNRINPGNPLMFAVIFSSMMLLWISWFALCATDPWNTGFGLAVRAAGACVVVCGTLLFLLSLLKVKKFENYHGDLITTGIYRYLRHPMYLGFILWMAGGALFFQSGAGCILAVVYTLNVITWKKLEEVQLKREFPGYDEYIKNTYF
jgi:protein-S-isoprenylcysteine O-methyltransferase Ste14